jgi:predicted transcriptional regulator
VIPLNTNDNQEIYQLSDFEKSTISESLADYKSGKVISNEEVISRNEEWLKK